MKILLQGNGQRGEDRWKGGGAALANQRGWSSVARDRLSLQHSYIGESDWQTACYFEGSLSRKR